MENKNKEQNAKLVVIVNVLCAGRSNMREGCGGEERRGARACSIANSNLAGSSSSLQPAAAGRSVVNLARTDYNKPLSLARALAKRKTRIRLTRQRQRRRRPTKRFARLLLLLQPKKVCVLVYIAVCVCVALSRCPVATALVVVVVLVIIIVFVVTRQINKNNKLNTPCTRTHAMLSVCECARVLFALSAHRIKPINRCSDSSFD